MLFTCSTVYGNLFIVIIGSTVVAFIEYKQVTVKGTTALIMHVIFETLPIDCNWGSYNSLKFATFALLKIYIDIIQEVRELVHIFNVCRWIYMPSKCPPWKRLKNV